MSKFITGKELEKQISDIIWYAEKTLMIVSPYIKLDDHFKKLFNNHINNPSLHIIIIFGKNEGAVSRSLSKSDFDFFKKFLNVSVIHVPELHAKYYGNEKKGVITSINLYDYSFRNNIEFGVYSDVTIIDNFTTSSDQNAWTKCHEIANVNEAVFIKRPVYQKNRFSSLFGTNYVKSDTLHDVTEKFYHHVSKRNKEEVVRRINDFPEIVELGIQSNKMPEREEMPKKIELPKKVTENSAPKGFCIRTGVEIPFNPRRPLSEDAFKVWAIYGNADFSESFCHKTGKRSNGKTSFNRPVLFR
jgi:hypothetical protein